MDVLEKVAYNIDILANIFKFLNLKEQLKLSTICVAFKYTLVNKVWRSQCTDLKIIEILDDNNYHVMLKNSDIDYRLTWQELRYFLQLNKNNFRKLQLEFGNKINNSILYNFKNLISISFDNTRISKKLLQMLDNRCKKLESLHMRNCFNDENLPIRIGSDLEFSTLNKLKSLKELTFVQPLNQLNYDIMQSIFQISNLTTFFINTAITLMANNEVNDKYINEVYSIENLTIGKFCDIPSWETFTKIHLPKFRNLYKLSIYLDPAVTLTIDDDIILTLSTCRKLRELSFKQCKLSIENFSVLQNLSALSLEWCWNIKWTNLKQILNDLNLEIFTSINNRYRGGFFEFAYKSTTLKTIKLETALYSTLAKALTLEQNNFENLSTVCWLNSNDSLNSFFQQKLENISLIYSNLQELCLDCHYVLQDDLRQLKHLKKLQFHLFSDMTWSYLEILLQHCSLAHLVIEISEMTSGTISTYAVIKADYIDVPKISRNLITNLKFLKIPLAIFIKAQNFWLDLLLRNSKLKIMIFNYYGYGLFKPEFLCNLLYYIKIRSDRKYINVCGTDIDMEHLKENFSESMKNIKLTLNDRGQYFFII